MISWLRLHRNTEECSSIHPLDRVSYRRGLQCGLERHRLEETDIPHKGEQDAGRILAFQHAYDAATKRLYPNVSLIDISRLPGKTKVKNTLQSGDRLLFFTRPDCPACDLLLNKLLKRIDEVSDIDIYLTDVDKGDDRAVRDWASNHQIDPDWMGSHIYRDTSGYYDTLRATTQVSGWAYNAARDTKYDPAAPPTWGGPYCKQWWKGVSIGLREKMINEADATSTGFSGLVVAIAPALASEQQNDAVAKTVLANAPPSWSNNDLVAHNSGSTGLLNTVENVVKGSLASGGVVAASAPSCVKTLILILVLLWGIFRLQAINSKRFLISLGFIEQKYLHWLNSHRFVQIQCIL